MKTTTTKMHFGFVAVVGLVAALSLLAGSCAQEVGEIDRTQPNRLAKMDLEGEWYIRHTTTDTPLSSFFAFVGYESPMERGTFEIQEDTLYFYRTYEFRQNAQAIGLKADVDSPYLTWLVGDVEEYTADPYQARDRKFAEGDLLPTLDGADELLCDDEEPSEGDGGMHDYCKQATGNNYAYCGHLSGTALVDRTHDNALCVTPTKYVFRGAPLAGWTLDSHFDLRYEYNPTTGEKTNVLVENTTDRYWYERDYVRIKWGENSVINFQYSLTSTLKSTFDGMDVSTEIVAAVYQGDTAAPDSYSLRIFRDDNESIEYMDFVTRNILQATGVYYEYWGQDVPLCVFYPFYTGGVFDCSSEEIETRTALMKVNPLDDYKPWDYDDHHLDKFGYYRAERQSYDTQYDVTYGGLINNMYRFDLWDTHPLNDDGTLDYANMNPVPIVYYLSEGFPRELVHLANEMARQWAEPFNDVVAFHKGADAVPEGGMFVLCENNNQSAQEALSAGQAVGLFNHGVCKDMDYVKYMGDLRYNFIYTVVPPYMNGLLGYGPPSVDPLSGKIVNANSYLYHSVMKIASNRVADVVELMTGYVDYQTMVRGADLASQEYPNQLAVSGNPPPAGEAAAMGVARGLVRDNVRHRLVNVGIEKTDEDWASMRMNMIKQDPEMDRALIFDAFRALHKDPGAVMNAPMTDSEYNKMALRNWANNKGAHRKLAQLMEFAKHGMYRMEFADGAYIGLAKEWQAKYDHGICSAVQEAVRGGEELAFKLDDFNVVKDPCNANQEGLVRKQSEAPKLFLWQEYDPTRPAPGDTCMLIDQGGFDAGYYWVNTCSIKKLAHQVSHKIQLAEMRDQYEHWAPSAWWANTKDPLVAKTQKFVREMGDKLRKELTEFVLQELFLAVSIHEVGHNLGLRHNFEGSTDAMNYHPEYWEHKVSLSSDGKTYLPVDLFAPETDLERENNIRTLQYSSIMDYASKYQDWNGLGLYDKAAIKFGYGRILEVFETKPDLEPWMAYLDDPMYDMDPTSVPPIGTPADQLEELFKRVHYTQIPNVVGSPEKIYDRKDVLMSELVGNKCTSDADCSGGGGCVGCSECRRQMGNMYCSPPDMVEVPYRFCSDELVGMTPLCDVRDAGADPYEIVRNTVDDYWWYWPFWGRWRGNTMFNSDNYASKVRRSFQAMKRQFQWWAINYMRFNANDWWEERYGIPWEEDLNGGLSGAMATAEAFNTLISVFAIPGGTGNTYWVEDFGYNEVTDRYEQADVFNQGLTKRFVIEEDYGKFGARPMYPQYAFYADDFFGVSGGAIYDRLNALVALTDPSSYFLNIDMYPDNRKSMVSFFSFFPDKMIHLLGGLTTNREENYAACVVEDDNGTPNRIRLRDIRNADDPDFCADGKYLYPEPVDYDFATTWYRIPYLAAYFGMALMMDDFDRRFLDTTRIFLKGHEDGIFIPEGAEKVEFADPMTGKIYIAYKQGDDGAFDTAWYIVNRTKEVFASYESIEAMYFDYSTGSGRLQKMVQLMELLRSLHQVYDYALLPGVISDPASPE